MTPCAVTTSCRRPRLHPAKPRLLEKRHGDAISRSKPKPVAGLSGGDPGAIQAGFQVLGRRGADAGRRPDLHRPGRRRTLLQIAKRTLGSEDRWPEIAKLNQGVSTQSAVPAGTKLRLPPAVR